MRNLPPFVIRYVKSSWRYRWLGLALAWAVCVGGWVFVAKLPNQYQSSARLYAEADAILGQTLRGIAVDGAAQQQVEFLTRTLLARPNLERVIALTNLSDRVRTPAELEALVDHLGRAVRIGFQGRSIYTITFSDQDPQVAQSVVRTLLDFFIERAASNDRQQMQNARNFVNQQIAAYEAQLRQAEQRRAEFRARYLDLLPNEGLGGMSRLEAGRQNLINLEGQLEDLRLRRSVLQQQLEQTPATLPGPGAPGAVTASGLTRLQQAERDLAELRLRFTDQHPAVQQQRNLIAELRASGLGGAPSTPGGAAGGRGGAGQAAPAPGPASIPNPAREALHSRIVDIDLSIASVERQIRAERAEVERLETVLRGVPQLQQQFMNLDRDYGVMLRQYEELLERREALQLAGAARAGADQVRLEVIEPPTVPNNPTGPNRLLLSSMVLLAGAGAGIGAMVLLGLLDRSFYTVAELRQIGLPVLGAVSLVDPPRPYAAIAVFAAGIGLLVATYGVFAARGPELVARATNLVARAIS
jgi:polysaccharide chain length determinant protein (PEP-CTERM system associated)